MKLRPTGHLIMTDPDVATQRVTPTFSCNHCNGIIRMDSQKAAAESGDRCPQCDSLICQACAQKLHQTLRCDVFWNKLERAEARDRLRREVADG